MLKKKYNKKIVRLVLQQKTLRVPLVLSLIFAVIVFILTFSNFSFNKKIYLNEEQIQDIKMQLDELEKIVNEEDMPMDPRIEGRSFTSYEEIVPFITMLESLFGIIDKDSKILVRSDEKQILINRYADYEVKLKPGDKMDLFLKAVNELQKSKYITKVTQFVINYIPSEGGKGNQVDEVNMTIRLYFE